MLPTESNTCSTIKNINALWLSPDEWLVYGKELDKNIEIMLQNEISKVNLGSVTNVSDQWVIINIKGKNIFNFFQKLHLLILMNSKKEKTLSCRLYLIILM